MLKWKKLHILCSNALLATILFIGCQSAIRFSSHHNYSNKNYVENPNYLMDNNLTQKQKILLEKANRWIGTPYCFGGNGTSCVDCSGFVQNLYASIGINLPRTSAQQAEYGKAIELNNLSVGDLLFFGNRGKISHVAIYVGNGQIIHSSTTKGVVCEPLNTSIMRNFAFVRRILE